MAAALPSAVVLGAGQPQTQMAAGATPILPGECARDFRASSSAGAAAGRKQSWGASGSAAAPPKYWTSEGNNQDSQSDGTTGFVDVEDFVREVTPLIDPASCGHPSSNPVDIMPTGSLDIAVAPFAAAPSTASVAMGPYRTAAANEGAKKLSLAKRSGRRARLAISGPAILVGGVLCIAGLLLIASGGYAPICGTWACAWGFIACMLAILPTDRRLIWVVAFAKILIMGTVALDLAVQAAVNFTSGLGTCVWEDGDWKFKVPCWTLVAQGCLYVIGSVTYMFAVVYITCCFFRSYSRELLDSIWRVTSWIVTVLSIREPFVFALWLYLAIIHDVENKLEFVTPSASVFLLLGSLSWVTWRPCFRSDVQSWLSRHSTSLRAAATIAAMLGGQDVIKIIDMSREKFRCISCDVLTEAIMFNQKPDPALYNLSRKAKLGEVDAFLSHSWSDDPKAKWDAIQTWRRAFVAKHGREPTLWIDKFCIDQTSIEENLACLPVFLNGSKKLLIVPGNTYLTRLWCVIEIFVFVEMGGTFEQLELSLVNSQGTNSIENLRELFAAFDANAATCFLPSEKDRLLSVVETGCGGLDHFNSMTREMLLKASEQASVL